jgi:hypothetical protein
MTATAAQQLTIPVCFASLIDQPRWLVWRYEQGKNGKLTKVPYRAYKPSVKASSIDPTTWSSFETAMQVYERGEADGIGLAVLDSNIVAFDVDDCRNAATGTLHPWAQALVDRAGTYAEVTPSKEGIRILGFGNGDEIHRKFAVTDGVSCEIYRKAKRIITITGDQLATELDQFANIDGIADQLLAELDEAKAKAKQAPLFETPKPKERDLEDIIRNGCGTDFGGDKSRAVWWVINKMLDQGKSKDEITAVLINSANGISTHLLSRPENPTVYAHRQIERAVKERTTKAAETSGAPDEDGAEIARLAELPDLAYEKVRKEAADRMGIRASILDRLVQAERTRHREGDSDLQGRAIVLPEPTPWTEPIVGADLLDAIASEIKAYVIMSDHAAHATACWAVHTFLVEQSLFSPRLGITSPTKGCGKTTLLDVVWHLVFRPLAASNVSSSAIFRVIEMHKPTLLIDEADSFLGDNDEMRPQQRPSQGRWRAARSRRRSRTAPVRDLRCRRHRADRTSAGNAGRPIDSDHARKASSSRGDQALPPRPCRTSLRACTEGRTLGAGPCG